MWDYVNLEYVKMIGLLSEFCANPAAGKAYWAWYDSLNNFFYEQK